MSEEIFFDGARFISANKASVSSQLTRDYIGKLCREGELRGKRVGRNWYVEEHSLHEFLVAREYRAASRSESLSRERATAYRREISPLQNAPSVLGARVQDVRGQFTRALAQQEQGTRVTHVLNVPYGLSQAALSAVHVPAYAVSPWIEIVHKLIALTFALALTFGTFALLEPQYTDALVASARAKSLAFGDTIDTSVRPVLPTSQELAAAAENPLAPLSSFASDLARSVNTSIDDLVYATIRPQQNAISQQSGAVAIEIAPAASASALGSRSVGAPVAQKLCVSDSTGASTCVSKAQLDALLAMAAQSRTGRAQASSTAGSQQGRDSSDSSDDATSDSTSYPQAIPLMGDVSSSDATSTRP